MSCKKILWCILGGLGLLGCREQAPDSHPREERIVQAERRAEAFAAGVDDVAVQAAALTSDWTDLRHRYAEVASAHAQAAEAQERAARTYGASAGEYRRAAVIAAEANTRWQLFRDLVLVAASIDAANLDAARAAPRAGSAVRCSEGMSTAAYRALLASRGIALAGMDVDHIVPRSLGGADHPENYRLLPASENRSLGNTWDEAKCASAGASQCAKAVHVSRTCGSFRGPAF